MDDLKEKNKVRLETTTDGEPRANSEESLSQNRTSHTAEITPSFGEHYEVLCLIGHGGMGSVYKVKDRHSESIFAIKLLKQDLTKDSAALKRFEQEFKSLSELDHPGLVTMYNHGQTDRAAPYLVMEYLEGKNLADLLAQQKTIEPKRATAMMIQLCEALSHAHKRGIIHRDIKPSNIIVTPLADSIDCVRLLDFGIARIMESTTGNTTQLTKTGDVFGTPTYMSPEQCEGKAIDHTSDIYSLGCVMYEVLTGSPPFQGASPIQVALKHINETAANFPTRKKNPEPLRSLEAVVLRCLSKDQAHRYDSVDDLLKDLMMIQSGKRIAKHSRKNINRPRWITVVFALGTIIFFLNIVGLMSFGFLDFSKYAAQSFVVTNSFSLLMILLAVGADNKLLKLNRTMYAFESLAVSVTWAFVVFFSLLLFLSASGQDAAPIWLSVSLGLLVIVSIVTSVVTEIVNGLYNLEKKFITKKDKPYSRKVALMRVCVGAAGTSALLAATAVISPGVMAAMLYGAAHVVAAPAPQASKVLLAGATSLDKNLAAAYTMAAKLDHRLGDKESESILMELSKAGDTAEISIARAGMYQSLNRPVDAAKAYAHAISLDPRNQKALEGQAQLNIKLNDYRAALQDYTRIIELDLRASPDIYRERAILLIALGEDYQNAITDISTAQVSDNFSSMEKGRDFVLKGIAYQLSGDEKNAMKQFRLAAICDDALSSHVSIKSFALSKLGNEAQSKRLIANSATLRKLTEKEYMDLVKSELFGSVKVKAAL